MIKQESWETAKYVINCVWLWHPTVNVCINVMLIVFAFYFDRALYIQWVDTVAFNV